MNAGEAGDRRATLARASVSHTASELVRIAETIVPGYIDPLVDAILTRKGAVFVAGVGTSGAAASKIAHSLACVDIPAIALSPADALHGGAGSIRPGDLLILISKGGASREINDLAPIARHRGAMTVAVTEAPTTPLAALCDLTLVVSVTAESDTSGFLATASTIAVIAVFDAVCTVIESERGFSIGEFRTIHPGGAVGAKLTGDA